MCINRTKPQITHRKKLSILNLNRKLKKKTKHNQNQMSHFMWWSSNVQYYEHRPLIQQKVNNQNNVEIKIFIAPEKRKKKIKRTKAKIKRKKMYTIKHKQNKIKSPRQERISTWLCQWNSKLPDYGCVCWLVIFV